MLNRDNTIHAFECCMQKPPDCANCPEQGPGFGIECRNDLKESILLWLKAQPVIRCKDCAHCFSLAEEDPMLPYDGSGDGSFYCAAFDMDFYAPRYNAETYFCADGERKDADAQREATAW